MKFTAFLALFSVSEAVTLSSKDSLGGISIRPKINAPCEPAIDVSQEQLEKDLDKFSRTFDKKNYKHAMLVYAELKKQGLNPKVDVHTWELYDKAFSFPRVRRYGLVQEHMDVLENFQDNLNQNFSNGQAVDNFIRVANNARTAIKAKYQDGEFADPADFDPWAENKPTWATVNL